MGGYGVEIVMETGTHVLFYGHGPNKCGTNIFSQFYGCNFMDTDTGIKYNCTEQWMMSQKALYFGDFDMNMKIMGESDPKMIKSYGRKVRGYDDERWSNIRFDMVVKGNFLKFSQNVSFSQRLLETDNKVIVEASPYDNVWGIGLNIAQAMKIDPAQWPGQNLLGQALMHVRGLLRG